MKNLNNKDIKKIISGANLFGTGGGGTINETLSMLQEIKTPVKLVNIMGLRENDFICTVFGVGSKQSCDPVATSKDALLQFQKIFRKKFSAIIPVEVGTVAIATSLFISSRLKIPVLDSDIVGLRSSPEVFLETITIAGLNRTPCVISDGKGSKLIIAEEKNPEELEKILRNFAIKSGGDAFVAGYPLQIGSVKNVVPSGSITFAQKTGETLLKLKNKEIDLENFCKITGWKFMDCGVIEKVVEYSKKGFIEGKYRIQSNNQKWTVIFKNENLILLKDRTVILTCPDLISLLDLDSSEAVNNFEKNRGKKVAILGRKAIAIWRTPEGKKLFGPKNLGLDYKQKLLA